MKVTAFAGGVGGARLADGLASLLNKDELMVIVNTGDDFEHMGLWISPDIDTVCHTLAKKADEIKGWGRRDESWVVLDELVQLGLPGWFKLGDHDLATHIYRTALLKSGHTLSQVTGAICKSWGIQHQILPMTNDVVQTKLNTKEFGEIGFQEYFVKHGCKPTIRSFNFSGAQTATPAPGILEFIQSSDFLVFCPSNPFLSIDPILSIEKIRESLLNKVVISISPIIKGQAVKGPLAKILVELKLQPSAKTIAWYYRDIIKGFVLDKNDIHEWQGMDGLGITPYTTNVLMKDGQDRKRLAEEVLQFGCSFSG